MRAPVVCLLLATLAGAVSETAPQQLPVQNPGGRGGRGGGAAPAPRTGTSVIIGRVVDGTSTSAVAGAIVTVNGAGAAVQRVQVDAGGQFVFRGLPSGDFSLAAAKSGYVGGLPGQRLPTGPSRPVQLGDGERLTDVTLRLWKAGAIAGAVIDEAGEPVVGIKVMLAESRLVNGKRRLVPGQFPTTATDDRGIYRFGMIMPGQYYVLARTTEEEIARGLMSLVQGDPSVIMPFAMKAMGGRPEDLLSFEAALSVYPPTFYPSSPTPSAASLVAVRSGDVRTGVDIRIGLVQIRPLAGTFAGLPPPPGNNPQVRLLLADPDGGEFEIASAVDTSNGRFSFLAVPAGKYTLRAFQNPRMPQPATGMGRGAGPPAFPIEPGYWASMPISVGTDDLRSVTLAMQPGPTLSGRIEFEGAADPPSAEQLQRLQISLTPEVQSSYGLGARTRVEADASFRTSSLAPNRYRLRVSPIGSWLPKSVIAEGRDLLDEAIEINTSDVSDVVVTFSDRPYGAVNGTVRNAQGQPDPDALVAIFPADPKLRTDLSGSARRLRLARTTKTGQYAIPGLPPGDYLIVAGGDDMYESWLEATALQALAGRATRLLIAEGARSQDLTRGGGR